MENKVKKEIEIEKEFNNIIDNLTDEQFRDWVWSWVDLEEIMDRINDWDIEVKEAELKILKKLLNKSKENY